MSGIAVAIGIKGCLCLNVNDFPFARGVLEKGFTRDLIHTQRKSKWKVNGALTNAGFQAFRPVKCFVLASRK